MPPAPTTVTCPVCGAEGATPWKVSDVDGRLSPDDLAITDDRYGTTLAILRCRCGFRFADPDEASGVLALYEALEDPGYEAGVEPRTAQQRALLAALRQEHPDARTLLDVGAATGILVAEASAAGLEAIGVEPSRPLAATANAAGRKVLVGHLPHPALAGRRFDLVTLVDVIEHVTDPVGMLRLAAGHLADDGVLLVVTPDIGSVAARILGRRWWHLRLAHVGYFGRPTLDDALERAGLRAVRWWRPGWVFEVGYLLRRVARYVPGTAGLANAVARRPLGNRNVPLNPRDSLAVLARRG